VKDLVIELRHKFITILKSLYWEHFEEGQCQSGTVVLLIESADRALDHEETELADWKFIYSYLISDAYLKVVAFLSKIPLLGYIFSQKLFMHHSKAYDIIVNFIDAHEQAISMMTNVIDNRQFVNQIITESKLNTDEAEIYMHQEIEDNFPEIAKAI
jgi:hypothetical protein